MLQPSFIVRNYLESTTFTVYSRQELSNSRLKQSNSEAFNSRTKQSLTHKFLECIVTLQKWNMAILFWENNGSDIKCESWCIQIFVRIASPQDYTYCVFSFISCKFLCVLKLMCLLNFSFFNAAASISYGCGEMCSWCYFSFPPYK